MRSCKKPRVVCQISKLRTCSDKGGFSGFAASQLLPRTRMEPPTIPVSCRLATHLGGSAEPSPDHWRHPGFDGHAMFQLSRSVRHEFDVCHLLQCEIGSLSFHGISSSQLLGRGLHDVGPRPSDARPRSAAGAAGGGGCGPAVGRKLLRGLGRGGAAGGALGGAGGGGGGVPVEVPTARDHLRHVMVALQVGSFCGTNRKRNLNKTLENETKEKLLYFCWWIGRWC